jgi:aryl-alcohol dehydrogenase-like predicted oxidoreductase
MLLRYALGQPVSVAIVGVDNTEQVEANVRFAKSFTPLTEEERENLYREVREQGITEDFGWVKSLYTKET